MADSVNLDVRRVTGGRLPAALAFALGALRTAGPLLAQQTTGVHDSTSADSIRFDQAPLPGGAAAVFRFLFSEVPQWIQIGGVLVGIAAGLALAVVGWRRRRAIVTWILTRSRGAKVALGASVVATMGIVGGTGAWSWNYMQHDNDFCSSCHVMKGAFTKFGGSEHDKLQCHDCHQQSIFASSKELYYWVLDRPEKIPAHAPVPNRICGECHAQAKGDSAWKRVIATAGHAVHFKSDSAQLKGLMCVDCHAKQVHAFKATDVSCQSSGCHEDTKVRLGAMANQSGLHCVTCHEFGRPVSELIPIDSTRKALVPARQECFSCHEMRAKLSQRDLDKDPHQATCGTCHNPHDQAKAATAFESCGNAGCHASADTLTAFHRGLGRHALSQCGNCHKPHSWKVESTRCIDCHTDIYKRAPILLRRLDADAELAAPEVPMSPARRGGPRVDDATSTPLDPGHAVAPAGRDTLFDHARHRAVACTSCHNSATRHGAVTVRSRAECQGCHHAANEKAGRCASCHTGDEIARPVQVASLLRITGRATPLERNLEFQHPQHTRVACATCHDDGLGKGVTRTCADCHTDHHRANATCVSCHADARPSHDRDAHLGCGSCHTGAGTAALPPTRAVCLSCHREQRAHKPEGDCGSCHRTTWPPARAG